MRSYTFRFASVRQLFQPRKPRHPLTRLLAGVVGLAILAVLVFFSVFVGAAMILAGISWKLLSRARKQATSGGRSRVVEGEYQVVRKQAMPLSH